MIFGNDNGEHDDLLYECPVKISSCPDDKYIFTGRWGSGKSAHLFLRNHDLKEYLEGLDKEQGKLWYIDENTLDVNAISSLRRSCGDTKDFRFRVEHIWRAEILRAASVLLGFVADHIQMPTGLHWTFVHKAYKGGKCIDSLWNNIAPVMRILFGDDNRARGAEELKGTLEDMTTALAFNYVKRCLADLNKMPGLPRLAVGIEPIDTPKSPLENSDESMAQDVIAALVNTFVQSFQPANKTDLQVYLSIPWHRYVVTGIVQPHKRRPYETHLSWQKEELRNFISCRIAWEFRRLRRSYRNTQEVWNMLFMDRFKNTYCQGGIMEDSFDYILRHTHHRPRDVQRICRMAVEKCSERTGRTTDDVLSGKGGIKVDAPHIRDAVQDYCNNQLEDFREEVRRRFPRMGTHEGALRGLTVPFTVDELDKRAKKINADVNVLLKDAWESGFIGIEVRCLKACDPEAMRAMFPDCTHVVHKTTDGKEHHRWYLFSYNMKGDPFDIMSSGDAQENLQMKCILHPMTFEQFSRNVTQEWPIGT